MTKTMRTAVTALLTVVLLLGLSACGDGDSSSPGSKTATTRSEDMPDTGPQSPPNPAGPEPVNGSTPANGS